MFNRFENASHTGSSLRYATGYFMISHGLLWLTLQTLNAGEREFSLLPMSHWLMELGEISKPLQYIFYSLCLQRGSKLTGGNWASLCSFCLKSITGWSLWLTKWVLISSLLSEKMHLCVKFFRKCLCNVQVFSLETQISFLFVVVVWFILLM